MSRYHIFAIIFLFISVGIFWYSYQVNAFTDRDDLTIAGYFASIYRWFFTVPESKAMLAESGFHFTGFDTIRVYFLVSMLCSCIASTLAIIHRIKRGVSYWFLPLTYFSFFLFLYINKVTYDLGVFYT